MRRSMTLAIYSVLACSAVGYAADQKTAPDDTAPVKTPPILSPAEEAKTFQLPPGYHMEVVLSDPVRCPRRVRIIGIEPARIRIAEPGSGVELYPTTSSSVPPDVDQAELEERPAIRGRGLIEVEVACVQRKGPAGAAPGERGGIARGGER